MAALALTFAACSNDDNDFENPAQQPAEAQGIPFTATISMGGDKATTRALSENESGLTATWTEGEEVALIHNGTIDKVTVASVSGNDATISGTITGATDGAAVTVIFPYDAADGATGNVKADLLYNQTNNGNNDDEKLADLAAKYDVRKGDGTLKVSGTASLNGDVTLTNQNAIFKFTTMSVPGAPDAPGDDVDMQNTDVTKLTVTIGAQNYVITPSGATSTLYAALPRVSGQTVSFTATDGSNLYAASKASVSFDAAKYYQSTVKMGKVIEVFFDSEPSSIDVYFVGPGPAFHYLHIGLDQAYAIAKQLSTQNGGAEVAVVYNHEDLDVTYALSSDASAEEHTEDFENLYNENYRVFLATLWESTED